MSKRFMLLATLSVGLVTFAGSAGAITGNYEKDFVVSFRERLMAESYLVNVEAPVTEFNLQTTANPSKGKGGTCNGDSGGPVFFKGTNVIAAVTSFGMNGQCKGLDFSYRLDRQEVLDWINDPNRGDAG